MSTKSVSKSKFISLKEAARISGYSSDYIGYLIREGRIMGRPVYSNISWQTTAEEVLNYKNRSDKKENESDGRIISNFRHLQKRLSREMKIISLFLETFRSVLPVIIALILSFSILIGFFLYMGLEKRNVGRSEAQENLQVENKKENLQY